MLDLVLDLVFTVWCVELHWFFFATQVVSLDHPYTCFIHPFYLSISLFILLDLLSSAVWLQTSFQADGAHRVHRAPAFSRPLPDRCCISGGQEGAQSLEWLDEFQLSDSCLVFAISTFLIDSPRDEMFFFGILEGVRLGVKKGEGRGIDVKFGRSILHVFFFVGKNQLSPSVLLP